MTDNNGSNKWIRTIINILVLISVAVSGYAVSKADSAYQRSEKYVCKEDFNRTIDLLRSDIYTWKVETREDIKTLTASMNKYIENTKK